MARRSLCTTAAVKAWSGARFNPRLHAQRGVAEHRAVAVNHLLVYRPRQVVLGHGRAVACENTRAASIWICLPASRSTCWAQRARHGVALIQCPQPTRRQQCRRATPV